MALANFGILQAGPDPYQRIQQAAQPWGAAAGVGRGLLDAWKQEQDKRIGADLMAAWDYKAPADLTVLTPEQQAQHERYSQIFAPDMTDAAKFRKAAQLRMPYNQQAAEKMLQMADVREREEAQMMQEAQAKAQQAPSANIVRVENQIGEYQREMEQLADRRNRLEANNTEGRKLIDSRVSLLGQEVNRLYGVKKEMAKGTLLENAYSTSLEPTTSVPVVQAPAVPEVAPQATPLSTVKYKQDLAKAKSEAQKQLSAGLINQDQFFAYIAQAEADAEAGGNQPNPKGAATSDWDDLVGKVQFIKARQDYNAVKNAREFLQTALNKPLDKAEISQIKFAIARAVTGPGVLTESEVNAANAPEDIVTKALYDAGVLGYFKSFDEGAVKSGIKAALNNSSGLNTAADNINDFIGEHNSRHPKYAKPLYSRIGGEAKPVAQKQGRRTATADDLKELGL